jgi:hypothetical protein
VGTKQSRGRENENRMKNGHFERGIRKDKNESINLQDFERYRRDCAQRMTVNLMVGQCHEVVDSPSPVNLVI